MPDGPARPNGDSRFAVMVFAVVLAVCIVGITVLVFATRPSANDAVAAGGLPTTSANPSTSDKLPTTTTRPRSTTTEQGSTTTPRGPSTSESAPTTSTTSRTTTTPSGGQSSGQSSYSPPGHEYTIQFPGRHQSLTGQFKGAMGGSTGLKVTDVEGTLGADNYLAILAELPEPLSPTEFQQAAKTMTGSSGGGKVSDVQRITVSGHPAVRFNLAQDSIDFDTVMVSSGTTLVMLMGGSLGGGSDQFDRFVDSLQLP